MSGLILTGRVGFTIEECNNVKMSLCRHLSDNLCDRLNIEKSTALNNCMNINDFKERIHLPSASFTFVLQKKSASFN